MGGWNFNDLTGKRFGRYLVLYVVHREGSNSLYYLCLCDCGTTKEVRAELLKSGEIKSCGCFARDRIKNQNTTHGMTQHPLYQLWSGMRARCKDLSNSRYGGRGISVCAEWEADFMSFHDWAIAAGWKDKGKAKRNLLSIERIDLNGDYSPQNCKFATNLEQCSNKSNNIKVSVLGTCMTLPQAVKQFSLLSRDIVYGRYVYLGWKIEDALMLPKGTSPKTKRKKEQKRTKPRSSPTSF